MSLQSKRSKVWNILRKLNREFLGSRYTNQVLIEGTDPRFFDVGVLSKLPIGAITPFYATVHKSDISRPVFGRDILEAEIWDPHRSRELFTLYNNHLKSHFVPSGEDPIQGEVEANRLRQRQAEVVAEIIESRMSPNSRHIIVGDMNDPPDSEWLAPMTNSRVLELINSPVNPRETRPAKSENLGPGPQSTAWTYRHNKIVQPPEHPLDDHIWLSPAL